MSSPSLWVWLSTLRGLSQSAVPTLLEHFGSPTEIYSAPIAEIAELLGGEDKAEPFKNKNLAQADRILGQCATLGIGVITMQDAAYPDRLKNIPDPPCVLYVKGRLPSFDLYPAIAVVGTRKPSAYGLYAAKTISAELADAGVIIVSGMAAGCDSAAHSGALHAGRPTVAVLGCGPDICYPRESTLIYSDIPVHGAIVSEYPPGTAPTRLSFPRRNRIISGLSNGILVAEAPEKSGALITADLALAQGRDVYAVPGNIDSPGSSGGNRLIKQGAKLVTGAADILEDLIPVYGTQMSLRPVIPPETENDPYLSGGHIEIYRPEPEPQSAGASEKEESASTPEEKILALLKRGYMYLDDIISATGLGSDEVNVALTMLELDGSVSALPGNVFGIIK
ncbi:MAG: DNA-processing protein DprA [Clostridia bacterium]|nr:DNA-processing protein DprA [Clostridia bacterium]